MTAGGGKPGTGASGASAARRGGGPRRGGRLSFKGRPNRRTVRTTGTSGNATNAEPLGTRVKNAAAKPTPPTPQAGNGSAGSALCSPSAGPWTTPPHTLLLSGKRLWRLHTKTVSAAAAACRFRASLARGRRTAAAPRTPWEVAGPALGAGTTSARDLCLHSRCLQLRCLLSPQGR